VANPPVSWKCPHCGEKLPDLGFWETFFDGFNEYLHEKSFIFWGVILGILMIALGLFEMVFAEGHLFSYLSGNLLFSIVMIMYAGILIETYMNVVLPLHLPFGGPGFVIRERRTIRNMRKGAHLAAITAILVSLFWLGPGTFLEYFPAYIIVLSVFLGFSWAISGLFLDIKMAEDARFRNYMERLGITDLKKLRRICTFAIGALFVSVISFFVLNQIEGLWYIVKNWTVVGGTLIFIQQYFGWLI